MGIKMVVRGGAETALTGRLLYMWWEVALWPLSDGSTVFSLGGYSSQQNEALLVEKAHLPSQMQLASALAGYRTAKTVCLQRTCPITGAHLPSRTRPPSALAEYSTGPICTAMAPTKASRGPSDALRCCCCCCCRLSICRLGTCIRL